MAIDEALLISCQEENQQNFFPTLRFYQWKTPTLSFGYSQKWSKTVNQNYCRKWGINIVRRLTGGRAVLHHKELTYSLVARCQEGFFSGSILETYRHISAALTQAFNKIKAPIQLINHPLNRHFSSFDSLNKPCFFSTSKYELAYQGKKVVGSAQKRLKNSFLQHGSIPLELDLEQLLGATNSRDRAKDIKVIALNEVLGYQIGLEDLIRILIRGFEEYFPLKLIPGRLIERELKLAERLCKEKYSQSWWNFGK